MTILDTFSGFPLVAQVREKLKDSGFSGERILLELNHGLYYVAGKVLIPDLEATDTLTTDADTAVNFIALPDDFHRHLRYCHSITRNRQIQIFPSMLHLFRRRRQLNHLGPVWGVARSGMNLFYQDIPSDTEDLFVVYYKKPEVLTPASPHPTCLPEDHVVPLLVNYALWKLYEVIEDGVDGNRPNTETYKRLFSDALALFDYEMGPVTDEAVWIPEEINYESFF